MTRAVEVPGHALLLATILLSTIAPAAIAANNTTNTSTNGTMNVTEKIVIANVSLPLLPGVFFTAYHNGTAARVVIVYTSFINTTRPTISVTLSDGETRIDREINTSTCSAVICRYTLLLRTNKTTWVYIETRSGNNTRTYNVTLKPPLAATPPSGLFPPLQRLIPFAIVAGLSVRTNKRDAGLGAVAAGLLVFLLSVAGVVEADPKLVVVPIVIGALLLSL